MAEIKDASGRIGVVIEDRGDCVLAVPLWSPGAIDGVRPGVGRAKYVTATAWNRQPDGSYIGLWYDSSAEAWVTATLDQDADGRDRLARCGEVLFGARWQSELARALGVGDRRVREWVASERSVPPGVWSDIAKLIVQRRQDGASLLAELGAPVDR